MEIERKNTKKVLFQELKVGDVFLDEDNDVMMVVDQDYGLGEGRSCDGYAVNLASGYHYAYLNKNEVIRVDAKVIVS